MNYISGCTYPSIGSSVHLSVHPQWIWAMKLQRVFPSHQVIRIYTKTRAFFWSVCLSDCLSDCLTLSPLEYYVNYFVLKSILLYRIERNTTWEALKIDGTPPPPLQPKRLGRIGSCFGERPLMWIVSGAPRRFLNFIQEAETLVKNLRF